MQTQMAKHYSIIIKRKQGQNSKIQKYSILTALKPLIYFASIFGLKIIKYKKDDIWNVGAFNKGHSLLVILAISILTAFRPPTSWQYTISDVPLNILTKAYGSLHITEVLYAILSISIIGNEFFVYLLKSLDEVDYHLNVKKNLFYLRVVLALILIIWPFIVTILITTCLKSWNFRDLAAYITIFIQIVEDSIINFFVLNIYFHIVIFNDILVKEKVAKYHQENEIFLRRRLSHFFLKKSHEITRPYCWFELIKIYDKISDSLYFFNEIYSIQILVMFVIWFMCTLLVICRYLSPSVPQYSEIILCDLFLYTIINSRPLILAKMCELFIEERKKTEAILMHIILHEESGNLYYEQVQTMFDLVQSRRLDISAEVFIVNLPIILSFAGKAISYGVLMIQYFYMHN